MDAQGNGSFVVNPNASLRDGLIKESLLVGFANIKQLKLNRKVFIFTPNPYSSIHLLARQPPTGVDRSASLQDGKRKAKISVDAA